jgi:glycine/D-amino acid oxidase-like deaminating enzyme
MNAARAQGARLVLGTLIGAIETSGGRVTGVRTEVGQVIRAPAGTSSRTPRSSGS